MSGVSHLTGIRLIDNNGIIQNIGNEINSLIRDARSGLVDQVFSINVENNVLMFPGVISQKSMSEFLNFSELYNKQMQSYVGSPKVVKRRSQIKSKVDLDHYNRELIGQ